MTEVKLKDRGKVTFYGIGLEDCPWCGIVGWLSYNDRTNRLGCDKCGCLGPRVRGTDYEKLVEAWNTRKTPQPYVSNPVEGKNGET